MARVNIYLPDDLAQSAKEAGLNVSGIARGALVDALAGRETDQWLDEVGRLPPTGVSHEAVLQAVSDARDDFDP